MTSDLAPLVALTAHQRVTAGEDELHKPVVDLYTHTLLACKLMPNDRMDLNR